MLLINYCFLIMHCREILFHYFFKMGFSLVLFQMFLYFEQTNTKCNSTKVSFMTVWQSTCCHLYNTSVVCLFVLFLRKFQLVSLHFFLFMDNFGKLNDFVLYINFIRLWLLKKTVAFSYHLNSLQVVFVGSNNRSIDNGWIF